MTGGSLSRLDFLRSLGLNHDPFITPVAEQETSSSDDIPISYSYYLHPSFTAGKKAVNEITFRTLEENIFIYGDPGSGKTTLRFMIEAECRTRLEKTLVVSNILGEDIELPLSSDEHGRKLAKSIAIGLFIQIVEQFEPSKRSLDKKLIDVLKRQIIIGGRHVQRLLSFLLDPGIPNKRAGISAYWRMIGEIPVKYVTKTEALSQLINKCTNYNKMKNEDLTSWDLVAQGFHAARLWGFRRILIMVDGVDTRQRNTEAMLDLIKPLIEKFSGLAAQDVYFRFFLPVELRKTIENHIKTITNGNLKAVKYRPIIIKWQKDDLYKILAQRFSAAGSHLDGFESLADKNLKIDQKLINEAKGSPRRLLNLASALIDEHLARKPGKSKMSKLDWDKARSRV